jgi:hypothetical protein
VTGSVVRTEDYWRWIIGRRYAHVIWVACQGEAVKGYAFVKDHRILEMATDPGTPAALQALLSRVRAEALERAYPEVALYAPLDHPAVGVFCENGGRYLDSEMHEGSAVMYAAPSAEALLRAILPELHQRALASGELPQELGLQVGEERLLIRFDKKTAKLEEDRLSRRYLTLSSSAFTRLVLGHTGIDRAIAEDGAVVSATTAIDSARILLPIQPIWRSPLDSATS